MDFLGFLVPKVHWDLKSMWEKFQKFAKKIGDLRRNCMCLPCKSRNALFVVGVDVCHNAHASVGTIACCLSVGMICEFFLLPLWH